MLSNDEPRDFGSPRRQPLREYFVDATEASRFLGLNRRTVLKMAREYVIPAHPLGEGARKQWRFLLSELDEWLRKRVNSPASVLSRKERRSMTRARYQKGSLKVVVRNSGLKVWVFRWRETDANGQRVARKLVVDSVKELPNEKAARERLRALGININLDLSEGARPPRTFSELIDHYRKKEIDQENERKAYSTRECYKHYLRSWIVPRWGSYTLAQIENGIAVHVEEWLTTIKRSRGTKAKIRNIMSAVCTHAIRYGEREGHAA